MLQQFMCVLCELVLTIQSLRKQHTAQEKDDMGKRTDN